MISPSPAVSSLLQTMEASVVLLSVVLVVKTFIGFWVEAVVIRLVAVIIFSCLITML